MNALIARIIAQVSRAHAACGSRVRFFPIICIGCLVVLPGAAQTPAGKARDAAAEGFAVSGTVIDSVTGQPLARALVQAPAYPQGGVFTDPAGHFRLGKVPATATEITARKPGYFNEEEIRARRRTGASSAARLLLNKDVDSLTIRLVPAGVISGRVQDADGEPLEREEIAVVFARRAGLGKSLEWAGNATTNDDGEFRVGGLMPGSYHVFCRTMDRPVRGPEGQETGYPPLVYFPAGSERSSALPIDVSAGQTARADFTLRREAVFRVSGFISGEVEGIPSSVQLRTISGDGPGSLVRLERGVFELRGIPAGTYKLEGVAGGGPQTVASAEVPLSISRDVTGVQLVLQPAVTIPVTVRDESSGGGYARLEADARARNVRPPARISVQLMPLDRECCAVSSEALDGDPERIVMRNVRRGPYRAMFSPNGNTYVASAEYAGKNILREELNVVGAQPLAIALRDDMASVRVSVRGTQASQSARVLFVSESSPMLTPRVMYLSGPGSRAKENNFPPGEYLVFALDASEPLDVMDREAIAPFLSRAQRVTLAPNEETAITADVVTQEQK